LSSEDGSEGETGKNEDDMFHVDDTKSKIRKGAYFFPL